MGPVAVSAGASGKGVFLQTRAKEANEAAIKNGTVEYASESETKDHSRSGGS